MYPVMVDATAIARRRCVCDWCSVAIVRASDEFREIVRKGDEIVLRTDDRSKIVRRPDDCARGYHTPRPWAKRRGAARNQLKSIGLYSGEQTSTMQIDSSVRPSGGTSSFA